MRITKRTSLASSSQRRHGSLPAELVVGGGICCVGLMIFSPVIFTEHSARHYARRASCQSNLRYIALGFMQYTQDNDDKLPRADFARLPGSKNSVVRGYPLPVWARAAQMAARPVLHPIGWADALQVYTKSTSIYHCPASTIMPGTDPAQPGYTDYWFNRNLSDFLQTKLRHASQTILLGDGNDGAEDSDATYSLNDLPSKWRTDQESPAWRHLDGADYAFTDGHVKWCQPVRVAVEPDAEFTFAR